MGWPFFAENRRRRKKREIDLFAKWPFSRLFARFFGHPYRKSFFVDSGQLSSGNTSVEVDTRETLQNKGFRSDFAALYLFEHFGRVETASFCGPLLRIIFSVGYYFLRFHVRKFVEIGFPSSKNPWGCRTELVLKSVFFAVCPLRAQIWRAGGARRCRFFPWISGPCQKWPCRCGVEGFSVFSAFFSTPFSKTSGGPPHIPVFFFGCFSLLFAFFLGLGATPHCTYVFGQLAFGPSYFLGVLGVFLEKHCFFPPEKGLFGVISQCLPFVSPFRSSWRLSLLFVTLSLFLSFIFLVFFLPCCLLFIFTFLVFWLFFLVLLLRFCFMRRTSKYYIWKLYFHNLCFFIFLFRLSNKFLSLLFHYFSCLCWWTSMFFSFSKKTISKTPILVSHIVKSYIVFFRAHFDWGKFWLMFTKHCKNRYFSTLLRTTKMNQIPFWGVVLWSE